MGAERDPELLLFYYLSKKEEMHERNKVLEEFEFEFEFEGNVGEFRTPTTHLNLVKTKDKTRLSINPNFSPVTTPTTLHMFKVQFFF